MAAKPLSDPHAEPPPPFRRPAPPTALSRGTDIAPLAATALAGAAAPLALAAMGEAPAGLAALAAAAVVGVAAAIVLARPVDAAPAPQPAPAAADPSNYVEMLEQIGDPIVLVEGGRPSDASTRRYVFANEAARALLRIQRTDGLLTTIMRAPEVLDALDEALYERRRSEARYELLGVQDRFWRAQAIPLAGSGEGPPLAVLWLRDETELRRSERTRADFLANASHELRTPLASLTGFIETLRGHARNDETAREKFLSIMAAQAERMRRLIEDLMSLSRIELGEHIAPSGVADLTAATADVLDALAPLAEERHVRFETQLPALGEALIAADRDQIVQVVQNLVENAVKYTPAEGIVRLQIVSAASLADASAPSAALDGHFALLTPDHALGRRYLALRVRDEGAGIARNHLPRLSERFYRVESGKSADRPGTGLGLAIVKHIVNRHRGGLIVESQPGAGTQVTAYFPVVEAQAEEAIRPAA
ncbi:MAG TPA: ATP-binding protein [Caulobacteraceae bacterium]|jgi:two-component system phosphate regulon sensor histidine kinase PhoR|nr:ATP-binding protein [Caulobacteraceae bacterium]